jgi:hypothetical protein
MHLARTLIDRIVEGLDLPELADARPRTPAEVLRGVHQLQPAGGTAAIDAPLTPLLDSALLTNSPGEPSVGHLVAAEIASADRIDLVLAFIRRSGMRPLRAKLRRHVETGGRLRVLTTTYTGSTEAAALDWLEELGAEVRVSYDTAGTRLHAKAWLLFRFLERGHSIRMPLSLRFFHAPCALWTIDRNLVVQNPGPRRPAVANPCASSPPSFDAASVCSSASGPRTSGTADYGSSPVVSASPANPTSRRSAGNCRRSWGWNCGRLAGRNSRCTTKARRS